MVQSFLKETVLRTWLCRTTFMETIFHAPPCGGNAEVGRVFIDPRVDVSPVFDGARHLPRDALHKTALGLARGRLPTW